MPKNAGKKGKGKKMPQAEETVDPLEQLQKKLKTEEKVSRVNLLKLNDKWRTNLRQACAVELGEDIAELLQTFERIVHCKDNVIKILEGELSEAAADSTLAHGAHLQHMNSLLEIHNSRLTELDSHWITSCEELGIACNTKREQIIKEYQQETACLKAETCALGQHHAGLDREAREDYQNICDDIQKQYTEEKRTLCIQLSDTANQLQQEATHYHSDASEWLCAIETINDHKAELELKRMQIKKLQDTISELRSLLRFKIDLAYEREECDQGTRAVRQLRSKLLSAQASRRAKLAKQTLYSYNTMKKPQELIKEGEALLRLAEMCRQLETEKENMFLFFKSFLNTKELSQEEARAMQVMSEELGQAMMDYTELENFCQRYNNVILERLCLQQEKEALGSENQQLMSLFQQSLNVEHMNICEDKFPKEKKWFLPASLQNKMTAETPKNLRVSGISFGKKKQW